MASIATDYTWWKTKNPFASKLHTYKPAVLHFSENPSSSHPSAHGSKTTRYIEGIGAALASSHFFSCELQERNTRERLFASNITPPLFFSIHLSALAFSLAISYRSWPKVARKAFEHQYKHLVALFFLAVSNTHHRKNKHFILHSYSMFYSSTVIRMFGHWIIIYNFS